MSTPIDVELIVGGKVIGADTTDRLVSRNPANDEVVAYAPLATCDDVADAVAAAQTAQPEWAAMGQLARGAVLHRLADLLHDRSDDLADLIVREVGKTSVEARGEVTRSVAIARWFATLASMPVGEVSASQNPSAQIFTTREPVGPVAVITPWNFPLAIPLWKLAPALVYGNTVVIKPSEQSPAVAHRLVQLLSEAGTPRGVLNAVYGAPAVVGPALTDAPAIAAVTFTGSNRIGTDIRARVAARGAKAQTELGGQNPTVVLRDANLDRAAEIAAGAATKFAGQKCTATARVIVDRNCYDEFVGRLVERFECLRVGDPADPSTDVGPVIDHQQVARLTELVARAVDGGARLLAQAPLTSPDTTRGSYFAPTLLEVVDEHAAIVQNETFGPVLSVLAADDLDDAIRIANDVRFGLSASICTSNLESALTFSRHIRAGVVKVNSESAGIEPHVPFGGMKESSGGEREQGLAAREFFTEVKTVYVQP